MEWIDKKFSDLSVNELFKIYKLRAEVFNAEQNSSYVDPDDNDLSARHIFTIADGQLAAYARYFKTGDKVTFGRVIVSPDFRGKGLSKVLVDKILTGISSHYPGREIIIHSQAYIQGLYKEFGFKPQGDYFIEADRKHIAMIHSAF